MNSTEQFTVRRKTQLNRARKQRNQDLLFDRLNFTFIDQFDLLVKLQGIKTWQIPLDEAWF